MTTHERHLELLNRSIDGELSADERAELDKLLKDDDVARENHDELLSLCSELDAEGMTEAPPYLRHIIMNAIPESAEIPAEPGFLASLLANRVLRYAATFAAGAIVAIALVDSSQISDDAFHDVTGLVGTMSESVDAAATIASIDVDRPEIAGSIALRTSAPFYILDFDLSTRGPVEIVAVYDDKSVWFNGFAQLESEGASVAASEGEVRVRVNGRRRYAVFLNNVGGHDLEISLTVYAGDEPIYESVLRP